MVVLAELAAIEPIEPCLGYATSTNDVLKSTANGGNIAESGNKRAQVRKQGWQSRKKLPVQRFTEIAQVAIRQKPEWQISANAVEHCSEVPQRRVVTLLDQTRNYLRPKLTNINIAAL